MRIFLALALVTCYVVLGVDGATKNVAIPKPGTACESKITFPVKPFNGVSGYPGMVEVFGIPIIAGSKFENSGKLNHVASIMAELLDQDGDGCADDPNVLRNILTKVTMKGYLTRPGMVLPNKSVTDAQMMAMVAKGFLPGQNLLFGEIKPKCSGLHETPNCVDASIEEVLHFITTYGQSKVYRKIFGISWEPQSSLTKAMDIARGKRMKDTPKKQSDYPQNAWSRYADAHTHCAYDCQAMEYLWWGYCSYSGTCAGRSGNKTKLLETILDQNDAALNKYEKEFKLLKKTQLAKTDKLLYQLYDASAKKTAAYRLPTKPVDGTYTGCKKCLRKGGKSHGGK